jgi:hypothetical protein
MKTSRSLYLITPPAGSGRQKATVWAFSARQAFATYLRHRECKNDKRMDLPVTRIDPTHVGFKVTWLPAPETSYSQFLDRPVEGDEELPTTNWKLLEK